MRAKIAIGAAHFRIDSSENTAAVRSGYQTGFFLSVPEQIRYSKIIPVLEASSGAATEAARFFGLKDAL
jgi:S-ribosylhomocysteine lyase LuxS involved in autoinducer biosynthesis